MPTETLTEYQKKSMSPSAGDPVVTQPRASSNAEARTVSFYRWTGYALLVLAVLDLIEALIPPGFLNPSWELQFMGDTIERSPVALLGFMLVFQAEWARRATWERWVLPGVSWAALAAGLAFLLMIPLLVLDTFRVEAAGESQIHSQLGQQISQAKSMKEAFTTAQGEDFDTLLRRLGRATEGVDREAMRQDMLRELAQAEQELQRQASAARAKHRLGLHKRTYKHVIQSAMVGSVLIGFWFGTGWARKTRRKN